MAAANEVIEEAPAQTGHARSKIVMALLGLACVLGLFVFLPALAPATLAVGFVAFWLCGGIATASVLALSGRKPQSR